MTEYIGGISQRFINEPAGTYPPWYKAVNVENWSGSTLTIASWRLDIKDTLTLQAVRQAALLATSRSKEFKPRSAPAPDQR